MDVQDCEVVGGLIMQQDGQKLSVILEFYRNDFNEKFPKLNEPQLQTQIHLYVMEHIRTYDDCDLLPYIMNKRFMINFVQKFVEYIMEDPKSLYLRSVYLYCARNFVMDYLKLTYPYELPIDRNFLCDEDE